MANIVKILIGLMVLILGILIWSMLANPSGAITQLIYSTPAERFSFSETLNSLKLIYFFAVFAVGLGLVFWGIQD